jgi:hypothetical protein
MWDAIVIQKQATSVVSHIGRCALRIECNRFDIWDAIMI